MHTTKGAALSPSLLHCLNRIALCCLALCCLATGSASVAAAPAPATTAPIVLYDGALGNRPDQQGFTYIATPGATHAASGGFTTLDTSSNKNISAGYFSKSTPDLVLDRAIGYTVGFTVQVELEDHAGSDKNGDGIEDRAGFSLLVLSWASGRIASGRRRMGRTCRLLASCLLKPRARRSTRSRRACRTC